MKKRNVFIFLGLTVLVCAFFTTCDNPIMDKWWVSKDNPDYAYVPITKDVPELVYETVVETIYVDKPLPPEVLMQYISIINIEYLIFSGDQTQYNYPKGTNATSNLTLQEQESNNSIVKQLVETLEENDGNNGHQKYYLLLHGHANPVYNTSEEIAELTQISTERAESVRDAMALYEINHSGLPAPTDPPTAYGTLTPMAKDDPLAGQITVKGYGGGRNMSGTSSSYAGLNRRVEAILFMVTDPSAEPDKGY